MLFLNYVYVLKANFFVLFLKDFTNILFFRTYCSLAKILILKILNKICKHVLSPLLCIFEQRPSTRCSIEGGNAQGDPGPFPLLRRPASTPLP